MKEMQEGSRPAYRHRWLRTSRIAPDIHTSTCSAVRLRTDCRDDPHENQDGRTGITCLGEVTRLLQAARGGDRDALNRLVPLIYDDLRMLARRQLRHELGERTMHPTSLVHEAYMKLSSSSALNAEDRAHFLAIAARAMRQVLVDDARRRSAVKRGAAWERAVLGDGGASSGFDVYELLALDEALDRLEPRQRQVVQCRFFGGMEEREIAAALGVTERTVRRDWVKARAWLYRSLYDAPPD
jgi:RNA polymerase sigma-70 factor, ECF subfamily